MLVLSRTPGEQIVMRLGGREVLVRVVAVRGGQVRLGFAAPPDVAAPPGVAVLRQEIAERRGQGGGPITEKPR
jgi:carbon storage regulator CsrA